jgi:hypothetical protein
MSDTPRTDLKTLDNYDPNGPREVVDADSARQLERELTAAKAEVERLRAALKDIADDYEDRFDMDCPSTNPGMKYVVRQARAALKEPK